MNLATPATLEKTALDSAKALSRRRKGSEVYAYNFPSQGVGAGVGSPALGAAAGFAGLGAGIGQAVMDGQAVPALGGIGTYTPSAPQSQWA